jgi:predicted O-methyltransferase YrrM
MRHTYADLPPVLVSELDPARRVADVPANQFEHAAASASGAVPAPSGRFVGSISLDEAVALYGLVRELEPDATAEVGLAGGASCLAILQALEHNGHGEHHVCDPYQATWNDAGLHNVRDSGRLAARMHFRRDFPEQAIPDLPALQFAFIDASHLFDLSVLDFVLVDKRLDVGGVIGLHDLWMPSLRRLVRYAVSNRGYEIHGHEPAPALTRGDRVRSVVARAARRMPRAESVWSQELLHPWRELAGSNATLLFMRKTRVDDRDWRFHAPF